MRLPSCIMGTLCIGVIALMGRRLFNWRVGLFAAFVYACMPLNIRWAQNAFYPSQCQFMTMLTIWLFYEAIRIRPLHRGYLTAASVTFCLTYLSWEGSGFLLPAFFIALMRCSPRRMVVVKRVSSLSLPLFHGCRGRRSGTARGRSPATHILW